MTTDHGVAPLPESQRERGLPGGRMTNREFFDPIQQALAARFGDGKWLMATAGTSPYLNDELIEKLQLDAGEVRRPRGPPRTILDAPGGWHHARDPLHYDAHIPLIIMGRRIRAGEYSDHAALNDLAPTLATLVGVEIRRNPQAASSPRRCVPRLKHRAARIHEEFAERNIAAHEAAAACAHVCISATEGGTEVPPLLDTLCRAELWFREPTAAIPEARLFAST